MQINLETLRDKFIKDPDWVMMEEFIKQTLDFKTELKDIDLTDKDNVTIIADIIANKELEKRYDSLISSFDSLRQEKKEKVKFR